MPVVKGVYHSTLGLRVIKKKKMVKGVREVRGLGVDLMAKGVAV